MRVCFGIESFGSLPFCSLLTRAAAAVMLGFSNQYGGWNPYHCFCRRLWHSCCFACLQKPDIKALRRFQIKLILCFIMLTICILVNRMRGELFHSAKRDKKKMTLRIRGAKQCTEKQKRTSCRFSC